MRDEPERDEPEHDARGRPRAAPPGHGGTAPGNDGPSAASYAGLGLQFLGAILLFLYVGRWLDARLGTAPWLLIAGVFVGTGAGFYSLYRKLMKEQAKEDARRTARGAGGPRP